MSNAFTLKFIPKLNVQNKTFRTLYVTGKQSINKTVLLRERKRYTDRGVSSTLFVVLYWGVGGTPPRVTPPPSDLSGVPPHLDLAAVPPIRPGCGPPHQT